MNIYADYDAERSSLSAEHIPGLVIDKIKRKTVWSLTLGAYLCPRSICGWSHCKRNIVSVSDALIDKSEIIEKLRAQEHKRCEKRKRVRNGERASCKRKYDVCPAKKECVSYETYVRKRLV